MEAPTESKPQAADRSFRGSVELLQVLIGKELKIRYKNTILGFLWSLLNPLFFAGVLYISFRHVLNVTLENYLAFLLAGLFPWQWFSNSMVSAPSIFIGNAALIKKARFPRILLPMAVAGNHLIHFLLALLVALGVLILSGSRPSLLWLPGIPLLVFVQLSITLGLMLVLANLNVYFRDLEHLTVVVTGLVFYVTPIFYPISSIPPKLRYFFLFNPMYYIVPCWRDLILEGTLNGTLLATGSAIGAVLLVSGWAVHRQIEWRIAESL